jgi:preprotein translocase subunit YajC
MPGFRGAGPLTCPSGMVIVLYFAVIAALFFILIVRPQRRQSAARRALIAALSVGDEVITAGGIYGTIIAIDDDVLTVEVAPGIELRIAREAIARKRDETPAVTAGDAEDAAAGDDTESTADAATED